MHCTREFWCWCCDGWWWWCHHGMHSIWHWQKILNLIFARLYKNDTRDSKPNPMGMMSMWIVDRIDNGLAMDLYLIVVRIEIQRS